MNLKYYIQIVTNRRDMCPMMIKIVLEITLNYKASNINSNCLIFVYKPLKIVESHSYSGFNKIQR